MIPTSAFTQLVAPLAQILALAFVAALYFAFGRRAGTFGLIAFLLNAFSLAALVGVEFVINLVFADLPEHTGEALRDGTLGVALTVASISFLLGTLAYVAAMLRSHEVPTVPLALYAVGAVPVSLRAFVPEAALDLGLVTMAVGIGWIAIWLYGRSSLITMSDEVSALVSTRSFLAAQPAARRDLLNQGRQRGTAVTPVGRPPFGVRRETQMS